MSNVVDVLLQGQRTSAAFRHARAAGSYSLYWRQALHALYCADRCKESDSKLHWLATAECLFLDHVAYMKQQPWARQ